MGGSTTQPMGAGASSPMGGAQAPMGQGASAQNQQAGAQQAFNQLQSAYPMQQGQGAPQDMSQFAGNGMMGMMGQRAPAEARLPPGYGPGEGSMPGMMGQGGQGASQDMSQFLQGGAGKGAVNPGAPGNYPPPPGYGPGQGSMPDMMGQGAPQNIPQFLQKNGPAMGALPPFNAQSLMLNELGGQGNIPIQAGARAPVAFGAPNPMGAPMLAEQVKAPPPPPPAPQAPEDYYQSLINQNPNFMYGGMLGLKDGGAIHPQDSHTVIQNALRLLSNRN